jgi:hypothetical protein
LHILANPYRYCHLQDNRKGKAFFFLSGFSDINSTKSTQLRGPVYPGHFFCLVPTNIHLQQCERTDDYEKKSCVRNGKGREVVLQ